MEFHQLYTQYEDRLPDFWDRRRNRPHYERTAPVFDRSVHFRSNHEAVLTAVDHCLPLYSLAPPTARAPLTVQLVVQAAPQDPGPAPDDLFACIQYSGEADWLLLGLGAWGHCFVDLPAGRAVAVLAPQLAQKPEVVARCLLNTVLTNLFIGSGYAMMHASCVFRDGRAVLLMADHNSGKSTTALRLALAGYPLLSDSMVFLPPQDAVRPESDALRLLGFPVGKIKLRRDMLTEFPQLHPWLTPEQVGGETKYALDLRRLDRELVCASGVVPEVVDICLLARGDGPDTHIVPATEEEVLVAVMANSLYYDTPAVWHCNLVGIERLIARARWFHLAIGTAPGPLVATVAGLWAKR